MKKTLTYLGLLIGLVAMGQPIPFGGCLGVIGAPAPIAPNSSSCTLISNLIGNDAESSLYIPNANMPTLNYRVNFIFVNDPTQNSIYSGVSQTQIAADAANVVALMNSWFSTCGSIPATKPSPSPSALVANPKLQLVLNNVYFETSPLGVSTNSNHPAIANLFPHDTANTFNMYFFTDVNINNHGSGAAVFGKYVFVVTGQPSQSPNIAYVPGTMLSNMRLIWHELGHGLGFLGDHYYSQHANHNPINTLGGYIPDDAALDFGVASLNCSPPTSAATPTTINNNLMSGSNCREHLSARQIAAFHYLVAQNITKKFTQFNGLPYPYTPSFSGTPIVSVLTGTSSFIGNNTNIIYDTLRVAAGADITYQSYNFLGRPNAKIIVEKGAKLTLECCNLLAIAPNVSSWNGIDVYGTDTLSQSPLTHGVLAMDNCKLMSATTGITVGKRSPNGNWLSGWGGGIVTIDNSSFEKNTVDLEFTPYVWRTRSYAGFNVTAMAPQANMSWVRNSLFDMPSPGYLTKWAGVVLNTVHGIVFSGCRFKSNPILLPYSVDYGIYSISSSFTVKNSNANFSQFEDFKNGIYANGAAYNAKVVIDGAFFSGNVYNGIFLTNINNARVTNNQFAMYNSGGNAPTSAGLYLNVCNGYVVENNKFINPFGGNTAGLFVRQSGPYTNSIYNNLFRGNTVNTPLGQGLWVLGQNYDPSAPGNGLIMNCNDFLNCNYDIGITKSGKSLLNAPNNTGVAEVQGLANTQNQTDNVRNTYHVLNCNTNDENKYNMSTGNGFVITSHGSFNGAQFHPTPQTNNSCSDASELVVVNGLLPLGTKNQYCPVSVFAPLNIPALNSQISSIHQDIEAAKQHLQVVDGGDTPSLLALINQESNQTLLKTVLQDKSPYVSDTVLTAYFTNELVPPANIIALHNLNKPVSASVWQALINRNFGDAVQTQLNTQQSVGGLSIKNEWESKLKLYTTHLGLVTTEKLSRFLADTTVGSADSVLAVLNSGVISNSDVYKAQALVALQRYTQAQALLNTIAAKGGMYADFAYLEQEVMSLQSNPHYLDVLRANAAKRQAITHIRNKVDYLTEGLAISLLEQVWAVKPIDEEKPRPVGASGSRIMSPKGEAVNAINIQDAILIYPNPANTVLYAQYTNSDELTDLLLFDIHGKQVLKQNLGSQQAIDISALSNGVYVMQIQRHNKTISTSKIVVVK